ncbi:MAG: hypothetical protein OSA99_14345, partial [Acidimicrobiales bacterium]|nr:hypothetical protein [Acidimicrobiales bacterium]
GLGSILGALVGVFTFRYLGTVVSGELRLAISGAGLLVVLYVLPGGFGQLIYSIRDRYLKSVARRRGIHVPSLLEDSRVEDDDAPGLPQEAKV